MDRSEVSCIKCGKGGNLFICSKISCPIAVHEVCLGCPAKFDDSGCFCCPYCLYKKGVEESRKAREYALARKKALLKFMDEKLNGSEKHLGENKTREDSNGHDQCKASEVRVNIKSSDYSKSKPNINGVVDQDSQLDEEEKTSNAEKDSEDSSAKAPSLEIYGGKFNVIEEDSEDSSFKMHMEKGNVVLEEHENSAEKKKEEDETSAGEEKEEERETSVDEEKIHDAEEEVSSASTDQESPVTVPLRNKRGSKRSKPVDKDSNADEEKIHEAEEEVSSASTDQESPVILPLRNKRGSKRSKPVNKDSNADPIQSKLLKKQTSPAVISPRTSARKSTLAMTTGKLSTKEVVSSRRAIETFSSERRKKLFWSKEEEAALRAGMEKYVEDPKLQIPWRKILEGSNEFHSTRTPVDLKDKWRNMSK